MSEPPVDTARVDARLARLFDMLEGVARHIGDKKKFAKKILDLMEPTDSDGMPVNIIGRHIAHFKMARDELALLQHLYPNLFEMPGEHQRWKKLVMRYDALLWDVFAEAE